MAGRSRNTTIWQWNCRGFARKRPVLQQFLACRDRPEIIALQEGGKHAQLAGYKTYTSGRANSQVATLVKRNMNVIPHDIGSNFPDHVLLEVLPRPSRKPGHCLFVLNVYSPPRDRRVEFGPLFLRVQQLAQHQPYIIVNAPHPSWGYHYDSPKGRSLWDEWHSLHLNLLTDPAHPTRRGVGVARDTTPDLTFVGPGVNATWCNTLETFGCDHYVLEIVIQEPTRERLRSVRLTDWDRFRTQRKASGASERITDISTWSATLLQHVSDATTDVEVEESVPSCDRHYAKLWARKRKLETLLQTRKWDKDIRRRLARVHTNIENYAIDLTRQNWNDICSQMDEAPNSKNTWQLLRHLLDPDSGKLQAKHQLERIFREFSGSSASLHQELINTYIRPGPVIPLPCISGGW
ncbi:hypothetical protein MTO96_040814 [Rhipicephalus appendiculatus]